MNLARVRAALQGPSGYSRTLVRRVCDNIFFRAANLNMACNSVDAFRSDHTACTQYLRLKLAPLDEPCVAPIVPKVYHAISGSPTPFVVNQTLAMNPDYRGNVHTDKTASGYIAKRCGEEVRQAFECLSASAYRADLFRFCAILSEGGVYLDADLLPMYPLGKLHSLCIPFAVGHDQPQNGRPGAQMKLLSAAPGHPVARCMVERIVKHVKMRHRPVSSLGLSGPLLLSECITSSHSTNVSYTHFDTRGARWPYTGLRTNAVLLAFERPKEERHWFGKDADFYGLLHRSGSLYRPSCSIPAQQPNSVVPSNHRAPDDSPNSVPRTIERTLRQADVRRTEEGRYHRRRVFHHPSL